MTDLHKDASAAGGLKSLSISGLRGIDQLTIPRLGRVTLIAGKNSIGKTTVLDAVRVYAAHDRFDAVQDLLERREELIFYQDEDGNIVEAPDFDRLFHDSGQGCMPVAIGTAGHRASLEIEKEAEGLSIAFNGDKTHYPEQRPTRRRWHHHESIWSMQTQLFPSPPGPTRCESLGPGPLGNDGLARLWDSVALTDDETLALDALRLIFDDRIERAAVIGQAPRVGRRVVVKLSDHPKPLPLKSLGDGATRMFGVALALANCRDSILLMDEAENGIHYSLQGKFWKLVLSAAEEHNTQVLATTHSKDCINGFAAAALECPNVDGNLVRIGRRNGKLRAVSYSMEELQIAAEQNIEVR